MTDRNYASEIRAALRDRPNEFKWCDGVGDIVQAADAAQAEIERLRAAQQWQPMTTAPMDGTSVLVINGRGQFVASWNEIGPDYCLDQFWHVFSGKAWNDLRGSLPFGWQPLPSPPTLEGAP